MPLLLSITEFLNNLLSHFYVHCQAVSYCFRNPSSSSSIFFFCPLPLLYVVSLNYNCHLITELFLQVDREWKVFVMYCLLTWTFDHKENEVKSSSPVCLLVVNLHERWRCEKLVNDEDSLRSRFSFSVRERNSYRLSRPSTKIPDVKGTLYVTKIFSSFKSELRERETSFSSFSLQSDACFANTVVSAGRVSQSFPLSPFSDVQTPDITSFSLSQQWTSFFSPIHTFPFSFYNSLPVSRSFRVVGRRRVLLFTCTFLDNR